MRHPVTSPFAALLRRAASASRIVLAAMLFAAASPSPAPAAPISGYANDAEYRKQLAELDKSDLVTLTALAKTQAGREVMLITLSRGKPEAKPAFLIVGNVHAPHIAGGEMALRLAQSLVAKAEDEKIKPLLDRFTFYIIPRPSPDATEAFFAAGASHEREGNARDTDDDRDGELSEDGPDDLNGDGVITMMRIADPAGEWIEHPDDPRVLIKADPLKNEKGKYRLITEGIDNDKDEDFNEDGPGGVSFNRNFTHQYPYFKPGAGANQVSEPETRAIADFAFDRTNIAAVITFTPEDNLFQPWKPNPQADGARIKTVLHSADAPYQDFVAKAYRDAHGGKDAPGSPRGEGSFSDWAYFHYGRWSFAARGWWVPRIDTKPVDETKPADPRGDVAPEDRHPENRLEGSTRATIVGDVVIRFITGGKFQIDPAKPDQALTPDELKKSLAERFKDSKEGIVTFEWGEASADLRKQVVDICRELKLRRPPFKFGSFAQSPVIPEQRVKLKDPGSRGADEVYALRWLAAQKIDGFVEWKKIDHPDFKNQTVEVGGFKPYLLLNPPVAELDAINEKHVKWLCELAELMPKVTVSDVKIEPLAANVFRVKATVMNTGYLPTMSEMGRITRQPLPLQLAIELPKDAAVIQGTPRTQVRVLKGNGGKDEHTWLIQAPTGGSARVKVWSASVGVDAKEIELKAENAK